MRYGDSSPGSREKEKCARRYRGCYAARVVASSFCSSRVQKQGFDVAEEGSLDGSHAQSQFWRKFMHVHWPEDHHPLHDALRNAGSGKNVPQPPAVVVDFL